MEQCVWTGNPGSITTENYVSVKAAVCPEAPWAGRDVDDHPTDAVNCKNFGCCFWTMPDGRIALSLGRTFGTGTTSDFTTADMYITYSDDDGITWTTPEVWGIPDPTLAPGITDAIQGDLNIVRVLPDGEGGWLIFSALRHDNHKKIALLMCRTEDFVTFTPWQRTFEKEGYFVINNGRIIRLKSGRILVPSALHEFYDYHVGGGMSNFFYSDDNGKTWKESATISTIPCRSGLQETGVYELQDGRIWAISRTDLGCQYQQFSSDGGETWSAPEPSCFISPCSPLTMATLSDGRIVAAWNPVPKVGFGRKEIGERTPMVLSTSADDGKTWSPIRVLDDAQEGFYCYPVFYTEKEGYLLINYSYTAYGDVGKLARCKTKRVELSEL